MRSPLTHGSWPRFATKNSAETANGRRATPDCRCTWMSGRMHGMGDLPRQLRWRRVCLIVTYVLPSMQITLREYLDKAGRSPFGRWFENLDATAAARVTTALARIEQGNFSSVKGVGAGVFEYRID